MTYRSQLDAYIKQLEGRLRLGALLRGAAILTSVALTATLVLVLVSNALAFSSVSITGARIVLFIALAFAIGFGLAIPLYGLDRRNAVGKAEDAFPHFQQRLVTYTERDAEGRDPFVELLAADTLQLARNVEPKQLVPDRKLWTSLGVGVVSLGILVWMIMAGPGYLGHGAALLWVGAEHGAAPLYDIRVSPGDATVRRNADQIVTAQLLGLHAPNARLYARYQSASQWEQVAMQPQGASGFQFLFAGLPEAVEYYVEAGPLRSAHFHIRVMDLPAVKQIRVTYVYPKWTGLPSTVDEHGGDLRAVEGTEAQLEVTMDRPMRDGVLEVSNAPLAESTDNPLADPNAAADASQPDSQTVQQLRLSGGEGNVYKGVVHMNKDGQYHVASLDQGQSVRLSDDFFIEARKANPPDVRIAKPDRDYRASPIEEVTVTVNAGDDFGLSDLALHYSVNGAPEKTVSLLKQKGVKQADGSTVISLEDFKLVPGDLVSLYATAKDAHSDSRTDISFIQAEPFEREFSQSQASGGGGGGGGQQADQGQISEREKEIIASTWKQQGQKNVPAQSANEASKFLSGVQATLHDQALSLAGRLERRELSDANEEFSDFEKDMNSAAEAMEPAVQKLQQQKWNDAIPNEQKALQHLLRAEATFRQIEVAFGNQGGGGGGGGAGRDLQSLFDLELDTEKNQYETGQTATPAGQKSQQIDDALKKLDELAKRQQELAEQQPNSTQTNQQRYQQEMLRREAEELQRQMQQMAQQGQQGQSGQQGSSASGQAGGSGQQGDADPRVKQALDQVRQAEDDMSRAASPEQSQAAARRAADRLREASNLMNGMRQQASSGQLDPLSQEADRLASEEKSEASRASQLLGQKGTGASQPNSYARESEGERLANDRAQLGEDLSNLEKQMQETARQLSSSQQAASSKLRDAVSGAERSQLQNQVQRSADALRRGLDPSSAEAGNPEGAIAAGIKGLSDQIHQAQQAMGGQSQNNEEALNRVERLREQMDALARNGGPNNGQQAGQQGQPGSGSRTGSQQGGQQPGQLGSQPGGQNGGGQPGQGNQAGGLGGNNGANGGYRNGNVGGYGNGFRYDPGYDVGGQRIQGSERAPAPPETPAEIERAYQEALRELNDLRQDVKTQPEPLADLQELINQMKRLDPSRFPGNPAMIEELRTQVLAGVDKLELQLRRNADDKQSGQIRGGDSLPVPSGYQDAVAEYFRRLSKNQSQ